MLNPNLVSVTALFEEGVRVMQAEHVAEESTKVGILRAGNTGLLEVVNNAKTGKPSVEVSGKCHRLSFLRFKGIRIEEHGEERELMFDGGRGNEDLWAAILLKAWTGKLLREEDVPISWELPSGIKVTGRPDLVLADNDGVPVKGIELKLVSSLWTARDVLLDKPKPPHLMQAAHYMWRLSEQTGKSVPFELWYTSRVDWAVNGNWVQKLFPKKGEKASEYCEYNETSGEIKKVLPFRKGFLLRWKGDTLDSPLEVSPVGGKPNWSASIVTRRRILDYFEYVAKMEANKELGPRPMNLNADGTKGNYDPCDYCSLKQHCNTWEDKGFEAWLANVPRLD